MTGTSKIEWTDATWNPVRGCEIVSKGCTNCYAMKQAHRFSADGQAYAHLTKMTKGGPVWTGKVRLVPELLDWPLRRAKPLRIFVNSMSDLFHEDVPDEFINKVFAVMSCTTRHTYQILTKRPQRMLDWWHRRPKDHWGDPEDINPTEVWPKWTPARNGRGGYDNCGPSSPFENVHIGVSIEDQATADERIPLLLQMPAAVRWISAEPLLGPVQLTHLATESCASECCHAQRHDALSGRFVCDLSDESYSDGPHLDWVVAGGESGPGARPSHPDWFRSLRDQCATAEVPFFFKQWGDWGYESNHPELGSKLLLRQFLPNGMGPPNGADLSFQTMAHIGKRAAGRELDGRTHDEYPKGAR